MTGGTSHVPAVRALFDRRFGAERIHIGDAFRSVASGLALLALDRQRAPRSRPEASRPPCPAGHGGATSRDRGTAPEITGAPTMSSDADLLADRRSLRRKLTLWRLLAVLGVLVVAVVAGLAWSGQRARARSRRPISRASPFPASSRATGARST